MNLLKVQYELLLGAREVMFDFIENEIAGRLTEPIPAFNGSDIRYLLIHTANTYKHWIGNFGLKRELPFTVDKDIADMQAVRAVYAETDKMMFEFLELHETSWGEPIVNRLRGKELWISPLELFTHVLTHEFHHKGQVMTMCRMLGHTPPDTDIIRT